jgi:hypothetical protein
MIKNVEEFLKLTQSSIKEEQDRAIHDSTDLQTWIDVISKYPHLKEWVIHNKTIQIEILEVLAQDTDPDIRGQVARKRKINEFIFKILSIDPDENVRYSLISNTKLSLEKLKEIKVDDSPWLTKALKEKLTNASS